MPPQYDEYSPTASPGRTLAWLRQESHASFVQYSSAPARRSEPKPWYYHDEL